MVGLFSATLASCSSTPSFHTVHLASGVTVTLPTGPSAPAESSVPSSPTLTSPISIGQGPALATPITVLAAPVRIALPTGVSSQGVRVSVRISIAPPPGGAPFVVVAAPSGGGWHALVSTFDEAQRTVTAAWPSQASVTAWSGAAGSQGSASLLGFSPLSWIWSVVSLARSAVDAVFKGVLGEIFAENPLSPPAAPSCTSDPSQEVTSVVDSHAGAGLAACAEPVDGGQVNTRVVNQRTYPMELLAPAGAKVSAASSDLFTELGAILDRTTPGWAGATLLPGDGEVDVSLPLAVGQSAQFVTTFSSEAYLVGILGSGLEVMADIGGVFGWGASRLLGVLNGASCLRGLAHGAAGLTTLSLASVGSLAGSAFECLTTVASQTAIAAVAGLFTLLASLVTEVVGGVWAVVDTITTGGVHTLTVTVGPGLSMLANADAPSSLGGFAVGFDPVSGRLILQAGWTGTGGWPACSGPVNLVSQTWAWDGTRWTQLSPATEPPPQAQGAMATDPVSGHLMYMGGDTVGSDCSPSTTQSGWGPNEGTWLWNGSTWSRVADNPDQGGSPALAVDQSTNQLVVVSPDITGIETGSACSTSCPPPPPAWYGCGFYRWTGSGWASVPWADAPPNQCGAGDLTLQAAIAYDPISHRVIQFGGFDQAPENGTLAYDGTSWTTLTSPLGTSGPGGGPSSAATDEATAQIVLLSGPGFSSGGAPTTWTWNGSAWVAQNVAEPPVAANEGEFQMVWDPVIERVVLVDWPGNGSLQLWVWGGTSTGWSQLPS